jgi:tetratricopeptide (TPR) repeat protein
MSANLFAAVNAAPAATRRLAAAWWLLALIAFALSLLEAVLLVTARLPFNGGLATAAFFRTALVLHVDLAIVVWFLAAAAGLWALASPTRPLGWAAIGLSAAGVLAMLMAPFAGDAVPRLYHYVPLIDHPAFLAGIGWFVAGVALAAVQLVLAWARAGREAAETWRCGARLGATVVLLALLTMLMSLFAGGAVADALAAAAWSAGHAVQSAHVVLMMAAWLVLAEAALGRPALSPRLARSLLWLGAAPALACVIAGGFYAPDERSFHEAFTTIMRWLSWPAAVLLGVWLLALLWRCRAAATDSSASVPLVLSILLFFGGCTLGAAIRSETTLVPAHYHGTVGAVTLAYMAVALRLLPSFGLVSSQGRLARWQPYCYGGGLALLALGLAWSGLLGVPRKTAHADVLAGGAAYVMAMGLAGLGGLLAVAGGALFSLHTLRACLGGLRRGEDATRRRDARPRALALTVAVVAAGGLLLAALPAEIGRQAPLAAAEHARQKLRDEVDARFAQGVVMLHARHYDHALTAFHRVLELAPDLPEAHVNTGFALIGLQRFAAARDFFESATALRRNQVNAYYGLAVSLEGLGDLAGALGAMRTYVHLAAADDPYRRKAEAALWEWEDTLKRKPPRGAKRRAGR